MLKDYQHRLLKLYNNIDYMLEYVYTNNALRVIITHLAMVIINKEEFSCKILKLIK